MVHKFASTQAADHILTVTINRPEARNALNTDANFELGRIFDAFEADPDLHVAILTGAGDKAFCAGADLRQASKGGFGAATGPAVPESGFGGLTSRFDRNKPVIAAVNGFATGGGFELALACDIIIACDTARFGLTEPKVGLAALGGGIQRLIREVGSKRANTMLLTGRIVSAADGMAYGFVSEIVPQDQLLHAARGWAQEMLACSPASLRATRKIAVDLDGQTIEASIETMMDLPEVKAMFASPDSVEGPRAFVAKRKPQWSSF